MWGQWAVYYTSPQSFKVTFLIRWLNNIEDFYWILIGCFNNLSVQTFQPLIFNFLCFLNLRWVYTSIDWSLSYPYSFLRFCLFLPQRTRTNSYRPSNWWSQRLSKFYTKFIYSNIQNNKILLGKGNKNSSEQIYIILNLWQLEHSYYIKGNVYYPFQDIE